VSLALFPWGPQRLASAGRTAPPAELGGTIHEERTMATNAERAYELFKADEGQPDGVGEWLEVDQDRIDRFADVTEDRQFIHVDPVQAAELSPWKVTIAHGFLTLSLLTKLGASIPQADTSRFEGIAMAVNYGFDKVRFINPVKVGAKIRASSVLKTVERKDDNVQLTRTLTVEIDGEEKPALVADWITRLVYT
jgi:acyl dehydratase